MTRDDISTGLVLRINSFVHRNEVGHGSGGLLTLSGANAGTCRPECHAEPVNQGYL